MYTYDKSSQYTIFSIYLSTQEFKPGETRFQQPTLNSKDFKQPFHVELFKKYHKRQHLSIWKQYQSISLQGKLTFLIILPCILVTNTVSIESDFSILR